MAYFIKSSTQNCKWSAQRPTARKCWNQVWARRSDCTAPILCCPSLPLLFLKEVQGRLIDEYRALSFLLLPPLQNWHVLTQCILLYWLSLLCSVFHPCSFFYKDFSSSARQGREGFAIWEKMHLAFKLLFLWQDTSFKHLKSLNAFLSSNLWITVTYSKLTILCKYGYHLRNLTIHHHPWLLTTSPLFIHLNRILLLFLL